jgi:FAD/FMN-containing dehydrogenase
VDALELTTNWSTLTKPWFDVWLPDETVERYVGDVIPTLTPLLDVGAGLCLLFAYKRSTLTRPFSRTPSNTDWVWLFDILNSSLPLVPDPGFSRRMLDRNRRLYDKAVAAGATRYPIGSLEFTAADWRRQYGERWEDFAERKRRFDPDGILTPGAGIFT